MDKRLLKRRLIGASVLVALGVIFIPMILSGGRDNMPLFGSNIPDKPSAIERLNTVEIPRPVEVAPPEEVRIPVDEKLAPAAVEDTTQAVVETPAPAAEVEEKATEAKPTTGWVVQVGSFGQRDNALAMEKRLREKKFPAFVEFVKGKGGSVYRVRVGPEVSRDKAEAAMQAINQQLKIKGVVMSHP